MVGENLDFHAALSNLLEMNIEINYYNIHKTRC